MKNNLKKYLFIFTTLIICTIPSGFAYAAEKDFTINVYRTLTEYTGNDAIVTVPSTVKTIGKYAFSKCSSTKKIIIPEGVTRIEYGAFYECNSVKEVTIPKSVTYWDLSDSNDGYNYGGPEAYLIDPANPKFSSIDGVVYNKTKTALLHYPPNKKNEVYTLPDSVFNILKADFSRARYLKHIIFNTKGSMNYIAYLYGNGFLNGILERFTVPKQNEFFCDIDGVLFTKNKKILIAYPENKPGKVYRIPEGTEKIASSAFCTGKEELELKAILFPSTIKTIEDSVAYILTFEECYPNRNLTFYGMKGSIVETYAKLCKIPFCSYDSSKNELLLTPKKAASLAPVFASTLSDPSITWKSSNSSIATVDQKGNVSAKKLGTVVISATSKKGLKASCKITVTLPAPKKIKIASSTSSRRVFTWTKVPGAGSYTIYRTTACVNGYGTIYFDLSAVKAPIMKLGTTTGTTFTDQTLIKGATYCYIVTANHASSQYSSGYSIPVYVDIPKIAKEVMLTQNNRGINISWTQEVNYFGLIIYRATSKYGKYEIIKDNENYCEGFVDTNVKSGTTYFYKIQLYSINDGIKIYSDYTEPVSIKVK